MGKAMTEFVDKLAMTGRLSDIELTDLLKFRNAETTEYLCEAARAAKHQAGIDGVQIWGRIQSRDYVKKLSETQVEQRTTYEVSVSKIEFLE